MDKLIEVDLGIIDVDDIEGDLEDFIGGLKTYFKEVPSGNTGFIKSSEGCENCKCCGCTHSELRIFYKRLQTEKEKETQEKILKEYTLQRENRERQEYERLREKFGEKKSVMRCRKCGLDKEIFPEEVRCYGPCYSCGGILFDAV